MVVVIPAKVHEERIALHIFERDKSPHPAIIGAIPVIAHHEEVVVRHTKFQVRGLVTAFVIIQHVKPMPVELRSDQNSKSGTFLRVLDLLKKCNFTQLNISVDKKNTPQ